MTNRDRTIRRLSALDAVEEVAGMVGSFSFGFPGAGLHGDAHGLVLLGVFLAVNRAQRRKFARANAFRDQLDLALLHEDGAVGSSEFQFPAGLVAGRIIGV